MITITRTVIFKSINVSKLHRGMTKEEVLEVFPRPNDINVSTGSWGTHEQWVYSRKGVYLYFEDGILDSWQY